MFSDRFDIFPISYPESTGSLVSGASPGETLGQWISISNLIGSSHNNT